MAPCFKELWTFVNDNALFIQIWQKRGHPCPMDTFLVFRCFPPRPKMPFGQWHVTININYTTYVKGVLGLGGEKGFVEAKEDSNI